MKVGGKVRVVHFVDDGKNVRDSLLVHDADKFFDFAVVAFGRKLENDGFRFFLGNLIIGMKYSFWLVFSVRHDGFVSDVFPIDTLTSFGKHFFLKRNLLPQVSELLLGVFKFDIWNVGREFFHAS